jgi:hypothetical protein
MSIFGELKRRKVVQVIVAYGVVAWLLVQIVVSIETPLSLPDWTDTLVIVLLGIGFPITVAMSWIFDLTPAGLVRTDGEAGAERADSKTIEYAIIGLLVVAVG